MVTIYYKDNPKLKIVAPLVGESKSYYSVYDKGMTESGLDDFYEHPFMPIMRLPKEDWQLEIKPAKYYIKYKDEGHFKYFKTHSMRIAKKFSAEHNNAKIDKIKECNYEHIRKD